MKNTKLRRFLPIILTLLTVIVCAVGITVMAIEDDDVVRSNQITNVNLVLDNDVDLVFWADMKESDAKNANTFMMFNDDIKVKAAGTRTLNDVTYVVFKYENIAPKDMADVVNAKLYVNGVLTSYMDYSVKNYCQYVLTNTTSESLKTLLSDLLVYGAEAQTLANESADSLITNGIIGLTPSKSPEEMTVLQKEELKNDLSRGATASLRDSKLVMDNGIELHFNVDLPKGAKASEYTVCLTVNGRDIEVPIISKATLMGFDNRVLFKGIYSYELFDSVQVNIYRNSIRVSDSMSLSLADYIDVLNKDGNYKKITNAYYNYCYSSHIYAGTHTIVMPGTLNPTGTGDTMSDDHGSITYSCSLCGLDVKSITASNIRTFDTPHLRDAVANPKFITANIETESLADGTNNNYLAIIRNNVTEGEATTFSYSVRPAHARVKYQGEAIRGEVDNGEYLSDKYTFSFDAKAPKAGLGTILIKLRNGSFLTIESTGAITCGTIKIAPAGTINEDEWTNVTSTISLYSKNGDDYMYVECYINGVAYAAFSMDNPMTNGKLTDIYIMSDYRTLPKDHGILLDNVVFAPDCVHSFAEDVKTHVEKVEGGNLRQIIDMVQNDFDITDFDEVVRWTGKTNDKTTWVKETYTEYQSFVVLDHSQIDDPKETPQSFDHPRVMFNSSQIPSIIATLDDPANALEKATLIKYATTNTDGKLKPTSSITPQSFEHTNYDTTLLRIIESKAFYYAIYKNGAGAGISQDEARLRGYEAIYAMKNYILTFDVQWKDSDQCRYYGDVMYTAALVYDWCYDLLTKEDKDQFRLGVQNLLCDGTSNAPWKGNTHDGRKLEGGFPALEDEYQNPLTGHGAEAQVLRDYFSFAIAIYDEDPSWYYYVGGKIYQDYVEPRNYFYTSGFYPDGSAVYNNYRYMCDLMNAALFKGMGIDIPYNTEDMATVVHGLVAMETYGNYQFATADGSGTGSITVDGKSVVTTSRISGMVGDCGLVSAYLFDDEAALAIAYRYCHWQRSGETIPRYSVSTAQLGITPALYAIFRSNGVQPGDDYRAKIDLVEYHDGFQQQVISRNSEDEDSVVVLMQGAQHLPGGHTHENAGNFQIWYKGILTRDDGLYDGYGSEHHFGYHMSATAHNTLLIYNNSKSSTKYYNGGQRHYIGVNSGFDAWLADTGFSFGKLIGMQTDDETNPTYVYFANDITNAYDSDTVEYVERSFMTLYTGDAETPMVMFVFDNITALSADFQKTFLLQCVEAPMIDYDNKTVTVDNGEGKLVLTSLLGGDSIMAYGRTSKNGVVLTDENGIPYNYKTEKDYRILTTDKNGKNPGDKGYTTTYLLTTDKTGKNPGEEGYETTYDHIAIYQDYMSERFYLSQAYNNNTGTKGVNLLPGGSGSIGDANSDLSVVWGHVEIQPETGNKTNQLMNVLYVSDSGTTVTATPTLIEGTNITGATFKNYTSVFVNDPIHAADGLYFTTTGEGTMTYYVGGLAQGAWKVSINGVPMLDENGKEKEFEVLENGRMISFVGEAGTVSIEPDESIRPSGSGLIAYNTNGGTLPEGTANYYPKEGLVLPIPTKSGATFAGWYLDPTFKELITKIPKVEGSTAPTVRVYAKWIEPIAYADYTQGGKLSDYTKVSHRIEPGSGTKWNIDTDGNDYYLLWKNTDSGSMIAKDGACADYAKISYQLSYTLSLGRNGSDPLMPVQIYIRDYKSENEKYFLNFFDTDTSGNAYLGLGSAKKVKIGEIASAGMTTFRIVLDFKEGTATAYNDDGNVIVSEKMDNLGVQSYKSAGHASYQEWFEDMTHPTGCSVFALKSTGSGTIRVYNLDITPGNVTDDCKNFGPNSLKHDWDEGEVIRVASTTDCTPGAKRYTCATCGLTKDEAIVSEIAHPTLTSSVKDGKVTYACEQCKHTFTPAAGVILDASGTANLAGFGNASNYYTISGTNQAVIKNGAYELINKSGKNGSIELWAPAKSPMLSGFSSQNNAKGVLSFKVNALTTNTFDFNFYDTSVSSYIFPNEQHLTDAFFRIFAPTTNEDVTTVKVTGWDGKVLANIEVDSANSFFDEWLDVKIYIEFDSASDEIILSYYINSEYIYTASRELTTKTNAINSVCITGSTSAKDSGIKLDDIVFGYTSDGNWDVPKEQAE